MGQGRYFKDIAVLWHEDMTSGLEGISLKVLGNRAFVIRLMHQKHKPTAPFYFWFSALKLVAARVKSGPQQGNSYQDRLYGVSISRTVSIFEGTPSWYFC